MKLPTEEVQHILKHTEQFWGAMRGRRLFLTGGTGFFGCWLLESFLAANDAFDLGSEVTVLTRDPKRFATKAPHLAQHPSVQLLPGEIADFPFPAGEYSHIVHAAAISSAPVSDEEQTRTIVNGTSRILEFATGCGAEGLLITSSGAVYGKQPETLDRMPEDFAWNSDAIPPNSAYTLGKRQAEELCIAAGRPGFEAKVARCFAFVGPHLPLDAHFAIGNFIGDALRQSPIHIRGDGTPFRSYLHAADLAIWLWTILFRGKHGRPYNVGSAHAVSIRDLAETVGRLFSIPVSVARAPEPGALPARYVPDINRARTELGLEVRISLEEAILRTAKWHQSEATGDF